MVTTQQFSNFKDLLANSNLPLLVVFYSHLCGPSLLMESALEQVKVLMHDRIQIVKIDSESHPALASQYQVHALPSLLLFKRGELIERIEEERTETLMPAERLIQRLEMLL